MTKQYFTSDELESKDITFQADLGAGQTNYDENPKRSFIDGGVKFQNHQALFTFKGEASTDGIIESDWAIGDKSGKYYTLGIDVTSEKDESFFEQFTDALSEYVADPDYTVINPCKNGKINLKIKFSGNKFDPRFNGLKHSVASLDDINNIIMLDTPLEIKCEFTTSFTFDNQQAKINLVVRSIDFPGQVTITPIFQQPISKKPKTKKD